jgi:CubicO group peptidase (beta-lactamase class C family)
VSLVFMVSFILSASLQAALPFFPASSSIDPKKAAQIPQAMQKFVDDQIISGAVTLVARRGEPPRIDAVGMGDIGNQRPMKADDMFWIASMTKPMTAVAVMMLQDEGKLSIADPVSKYLPEFTNLWMVLEQSSDKLTLTRAPRTITIKDLLTHTSGMGEVKAPRFDCSLAELVMAYAQQPLHFAPGTKWEYSNAGINTLGRIVEIVAKQRFEVVLEKRLLHPLGMLDTTFWLTPAQFKRLARTYKTGSRSLEEVENTFMQPIMDRHRTPFPAGGLFSTARDVGIFYEMMLNKGTYRGKTILSEESANAMTRTQTGNIKTGFVEGMSWGLGFQVVKTPSGVTGPLSPGTFGHGGAYATQSWADPAKDLIMVLMIQRAGFANGDDSPVRKVFNEVAVAAAAR